ncbi:MAG: hypothetical protein M3Q46_13150 [Verrucomicrobiota bacterium]|nr:hypothetical protein [Verrucomicrobiota bacterium]
MGLIRSLFWFLLFVFFTFSFVVLFEYGTTDFVAGFQKELSRVTSYVQNTIQAPKKKTDDAKP